MTHRCAWVTTDPLYIHYHDHEWGVPVYTDQVLFECLILEGMQSGLSWLTVLKKRENFRTSLDNFNAEIIAAYDEKKIDELMNNSGIIRNRLKIHSVITNARAYLKIRKKPGDFSSYIWNFVGGNPQKNQWKEPKEVPSSTPVSDAMAADLRKCGFKFTGTTVCYAFMQATGLVNDHTTNCFRYSRF